MPDQAKRTRVVVMAQPGATQQQIGAALNSQADFHLVDLVTSLDKAPQLIRAAQADLILVDHVLDGQPTLDILDDLALQFPEAATIAILPDSDPVRAQQVMLAGARGFVIQPFTQVNLLSTLRRVRDLEARRSVGQVEVAAQAVEGQRPLRVLSVFGPRGGAGTSTLALNLAVSLADQTDKRVLLLEGKLIFGHLGLMLNLRSRNTLADLLPHALALDENLVREVVAQHAAGIDVLLSPTSLEVAQGVRPEPLFSVVDGLRRFYDYVVIDAGSVLDENTVTLLDLADRVLLVTLPDLAALHDISRFAHISRTLAYPPHKVLTVLNRAGVPGGVRTKDIETALRHELFAHVPDDSGAALRSLNRGLPLVFRYPRSPASRGIQRLARSLVKLGDTAAAASPAAPAANGRTRFKLPLRAPAVAKPRVPRA